MSIDFRLRIPGNPVHKEPAPASSTLRSGNNVVLQHDDRPG
ncbi:hypothetical protein [Paenibacillus helianthi]|nr:hypothetical protein [Paenibacillus helianthi]